ncbi:ParA family protein [Helicobacter pametensis]|uniref:ParA family protein n=1 Tax=Helicobacter pametensis TaxID=95149 RepID=UPI000482CA95|nr:AAA family ATPase [Helicobacter pametensis]
MKIISFFNHKGGVSKTTTTYNLGWALSRLGKKVLLVDLDPQCNLTGLVLAHQAIDDDFMNSFYQNRNNLTFDAIVNKIIDGAIGSELAKDGSIYPIDQENLFLLAGSLKLSELDSQVTAALKITSGLPILGKIITGFFDTLENIAKYQDMDYLLLDLSPSIGGLNQLALMGSDYFIVPTSPDYFCLQAIHSLSKKIKEWHLEINAFKQTTKINIKNNPLFLGTIQQRFRLRNSAPTKAFEKWIEQIRNAVNQTLVPQLQTINCTIGASDFSKVITENLPYDLAQIPDFNTLIAISQRSQKPVFLLEEKDLKEAKQFGSAEATSKEKIEDFKSLFERLGCAIIDLTQSNDKK